MSIGPIASARVRVRLIRNYDGSRAGLPSFTTGQVIDALIWLAECLCDLDYAVPYEPAARLRWKDAQ
jgi:hypothetical protein